MKLLLSNNERIFCFAYSSGNGKFSNALCTNKHGFIFGDNISIPFTKMARPCDISLWHKRCLAVGHGN